MFLTIGPRARGSCFNRFEPFTNPYPFCLQALDVLGLTEEEILKNLNTPTSAIVLFEPWSDYDYTSGESFLANDVSWTYVISIDSQDFECPSDAYR
jgi:hypothetical protein